MEEKPTDTIEKAKKDAARPTVSTVLADGSLAEMLHRPEENRTHFCVSKDGGFRYETNLLVNGQLLVPYSPRNNLLTNEVVLFPLRAFGVRLRVKAGRRHPGFHPPLRGHFPALRADRQLLRAVHLGLRRLQRAALPEASRRHRLGQDALLVDARLPLLQAYFRQRRFHGLAPVPHSRLHARHANRGRRRLPVFGRKGRTGQNPEQRQWAGAFPSCAASRLADVNSALGPTRSSARS